MNESSLHTGFSRTETALRHAFPVTLPVLFGYLAIGIPFGIMVVKAGYPWFLSPIMGIFMYAGAGQYIAIGLFAAGVPLSGLLVTTLMVNIRHIVYGLSLTEKFKNTGKLKPYLIFSLTDETYALLTGVNVPENVPPGYFYTAVAGLNQLYWVTGSCIGALAGKYIPYSFAGIDFALTALFAVLLVNQLRTTTNALPAVIGTVCAILSLLIVGKPNMLLVALAAGLAVLILLRGKQK